MFANNDYTPLSTTHMVQTAMGKKNAWDSEYNEIVIIRNIIFLNHVKTYMKRQICVCPLMYGFPEPSSHRQM